MEDTCIYLRDNGMSTIPIKFDRYARDEKYPVHLIADCKERDKLRLLERYFEIYINESINKISISVPGYDGADTLDLKVSPNDEKNKNLHFQSKFNEVTKEFDFFLKRGDKQNPDADEIQLILTLPEKIFEDDSIISEIKTNIKTGKIIIKLTNNEKNDESTSISKCISLVEVKEKVDVYLDNLKIKGENIYFTKEENKIYLTNPYYHHLTQSEKDSGTGYVPNELKISLNNSGSYDSGSYNIEKLEVLIPFKHKSHNIAMVTCGDADNLKSNEIVFIREMNGDHREDKSFDYLQSQPHEGYLTYKISGKELGKLILSGTEQPITIIIQNLYSTLENVDTSKIFVTCYATNCIPRTMSCDFKLAYLKTGMIKVSGLKKDAEYKWGEDIRCQFEVCGADAWDFNVSVNDLNDTRDFIKIEQNGVNYKLKKSKFTIDDNKKNLMHKGEFIFETFNYMDSKDLDKISNIHLDIKVDDRNSNKLKLNNPSKLNSLKKSIDEWKERFFSTTFDDLQTAAFDLDLVRTICEPTTSAFGYFWCIIWVSKNGIWITLTSTMDKDNPRAHLSSTPIKIRISETVKSPNEDTEKVTSTTNLPVAISATANPNQFVLAYKSTKNEKIVLCNAEIKLYDIDQCSFTFSNIGEFNDQVKTNYRFAIVHQSSYSSGKLCHGKTFLLYISQDLHLWITSDDYQGQGFTLSNKGMIRELYNSDTITKMIPIYTSPAILTREDEYRKNCFHVVYRIQPDKKLLISFTDRQDINAGQDPPAHYDSYMVENEVFLVRTSRYDWGWLHQSQSKLELPLKDLNELNSISICEGSDYYENSLAITLSIKENADKFSIKILTCEKDSFSYYRNDFRTSTQDEYHDGPYKAEDEYLKNVSIIIRMMEKAL